MCEHHTEGFNLPVIGVECDSSRLSDVGGYQYFVVGTRWVSNAYEMLAHVSVVQQSGFRLQCDGINPSSRS